MAGLLGGAPLQAAVEKADSGAAWKDWVRSPYRHFRDGQAVPGGRAVVFDEADDPGLRAELAAELGRLEDDLYVRQGWRAPFASGEILRVYVARGESGGVHVLSSRMMEKGLLVEPVVLIDATGLSSGEIVREVARQVARATLDGYGIDDEFLSPALAEFLITPAGEARSLETWTLAAAAELDFTARPATLGRLWVAEVARIARSTTLREAWQRAADIDEPATGVLLQQVSEESGRTEESILLGAAARLYASLEPEASPSRLRLLDVESGSIDASAPAPLTVRHRTFLPEVDETLRVAWPQDGGAGAAVVRYRDESLPPDVVFFEAGERRSIPLSGVARIDWLIAGGAGGGRGLAAPVYCDLSATVPFSGLEARAAGETGGPRLTWTTASHEGLWGWAVFREEVLPGGRIARKGPEIVPSTEASPESFRYEFVDSASTPGTYYRYTVWAVTGEGVLARAFAVTLKTAD